MNFSWEKKYTLRGKKKTQFYDLKEWMAHELYQGKKYGTFGQALANGIKLFTISSKIKTALAAGPLRGFICFWAHCSRDPIGFCAHEEGR